MTPEHRYFDGNVELVPSTSVIEAYKSDKDFIQIAYQKAYWEIYRELKLTKGSAIPTNLVVIRQKKILDEWADKAKKGAGFGDTIHNILYRFNTGQGISAEERPVVKAVNDTGLFRFSEQSFHEIMLGSKELGVAGTIDRLDLRSKKDMLVDVTDYKTNLTGLCLDSVRIKPDGKVNKLNIYMKDPIAFMEESDYNLYCIQLGLYAYMLEVLYGVKIGRLIILYIQIPQDMDLIDAYLLTQVTVYPVPYMRPVIKMILEDGTWRMAYHSIRQKKADRKQYGTTKPLPLIPSSSAPAATEEIEEDVW